AHLRHKELIHPAFGDSLWGCLFPSLDVETDPRLLVFAEARVYHLVHEALHSVSQPSRISLVARRQGEVVALNGVRFRELHAGDLGLTRVLSPSLAPGVEVSRRRPSRAAEGCRTPCPNRRSSFAQANLSRSQSSQLSRPAIVIPSREPVSAAMSGRSGAS